MSENLAFRFPLVPQAVPKQKSSLCLKQNQPTPVKNVGNNKRFSAVAASLRARLTVSNIFFPLAAGFLYGAVLANALAIDGPLTPEQSLQYLKTEPGLKVEVVAAEPM